MVLSCVTTTELWGRDVVILIFQSLYMSITYVFFVWYYDFTRIPSLQFQILLVYVIPETFLPYLHRMHVS